MTPMKQIFIRRLPRTTDGTFSVIYDERIPFALGVERPWKNNQPFISCIPKGEYTCRRYSSSKYPNVWQICDVQGRTLCLIHWGNFPEDVEGCIAIGEKFSELSNRDGLIETGIGESRSSPHEGFNEFMDRTKGLDSFKLIIEEATSWES